MIEKLEAIEERYEALALKVGDPEVIARNDEWKKLAKEHADLTETVEKYREYKAAESERTEADKLLKGEKDASMRELLEEEIYDLGEKLKGIQDELKELLLPKDPNDEKNVIMEIRAGAGGEEAALFAFELYRMYARYAEKRRWKIEEIDNNSTELGGVKEVVFSVSGKGVYSRLKYESGVHRVQRVPETESQGRIHTSTATVAVLPEVEDIEVTINENDLRVDTYRSSGAGGQKVNKTDSCIRMTHIPTGIVVTCQDERSQIKNREKALRVLKSRLYDYYSTRYEAEYTQNRRSQIGTGDRSERIRTYNFPENRVSDHRIKLTLYILDSFLLGNMDEVLDALAIADREAMLAGNE